MESLAKSLSKTFLHVQDFCGSALTVSVRGDLLVISIDSTEFVVRDPHMAEAIADNMKIDINRAVLAIRNAGTKRNGGE